MTFYMRRPVQPEIVEAEQISAGAQHHPQGSRSAKPGEWVLYNHATGVSTVLTNDEFIRDYVTLNIPVEAQSTNAPGMQIFSEAAMPSMATRDRTGRALTTQPQPEPNAQPPAVQLGGPNEPSIAAVLPQTAEALGVG